MRQKRAKSYKKQINLYLHTFKFREPFQTIVDDKIILECEKASFDIVKGLNRTIQAETKPMITQCCMQALYATDNQAAISVAKTFERRRCNHPPSDPQPPASCIRSIVDIDGENKHRYVVATQSMTLRRRLRFVPGVPLVFMNRSVMIMEPASDATQRLADKKERSKLKSGLNDIKVGYVEKESEESEEKKKKKKRKGPSEPNPLSVKKKKVTPKPSEEQKPKTKRVRHHKKSTSSAANDTSAEPEAMPNSEEGVSDTTQVFSKDDNESKETSTDVNTQETKEKEYD